MSVKGAIHSIETFGSVDGPGVRFVVFLKGCAMRCKYCHNPDTWKCGTPDTDSETLLKKALRYRTYWGKSGGITVSGGEPLLQLDFLLDLFQKAKKEHIHTVIDTAGNPFTMEEPFFDKFQQLMDVTDLLLLDLKVYDEEKHRTLCGHSNRNILAMARYLSDIGKPVWIRHVLVPGINDSDEDLKQLDAFLQTLHNVERVEILPYHSMGVYKWKELGIPYELTDLLPPDQESIARVNALLHTSEYPKK